MRRMPDTQDKYWFPAKKYGWGWGLPNRWQGRVVLAAYFALVLGGTRMLRMHGHVGPFVAYTVLITLVLLAICWRTGEPPRWRWGGE